MFTLLGIFDLARYLAVQAIINKGAAQGLNLAAKLSSFDNNIRNLAPGDPDYQAFAEARRRVLREATRVPLATLLTNFDTPSSAQLLAITDTDPELTLAVTDPIPTVTSGATVFRPGDRTLVSDGTTTNWVSHPTYPPDAGGLPPQDVHQLLRIHPIVVEVHARLEMFSPFLHDTVIVGRAVGYREDVPKAPLPLVAGALEGMSTTTTLSSTTTTSIYPSASTTTTSVMATCWVDWAKCIQRSNIPIRRPRCPVDAIGYPDGSCNCELNCAIGAQ